jgi:DinB superfamily
MKRYAITLVGLAGLLASPLAVRAQAPTPSVPDAIRQSYDVIKNNLLKAADKMPEDGYDFKPTPAERSFGGWVAHVADAQSAGCSRALGNPAGGGAALKTSKADLVAALKDSFQVCDAAYAALSDANASEPVPSFRGPLPRLAALAGNVAHDNECYGAMAVYLRLKGIVPPSSEPRH